MSEQYKGFELNVAGDKNWADRELNLHKKQIDFDAFSNTRDATGSIHYKLQSTAGVDCNYNTINSIRHGTVKVVATPIGTPIVSLDFNDASQINGWIFGAGITAEITQYKIENVLHLHVPAGYSGRIATYALDYPFLLDFSFPYTVYHTFATASTNQSDAALFGIFGVNENLGMSFYNRSFPTTSFYSTHSNFTQNPPGTPPLPQLAYAINTQSPFSGAVDIYLSDMCVKVDDATRRGTGSDLSAYYAVIEYLNGTGTPTVKSVSGCFVGNEPTLESSTISHPTENMSIEVFAEILALAQHI